MGTGNVSLLYEEPTGVSIRYSSGSSSFISYWLELDPWGAEVYRWDPYVGDPEFSGGRGEGGPIFPGVGDISMPSTGCSLLLDGVLTLCDFASRTMNNDGLLVERQKRNGTREYLPVTVLLGEARVVNLRPPRAVPLQVAMYDELPDGPERFLQDFGFLEVLYLEVGAQYIVPLPSNLRERVADRVNNPGTGCGELLRKVIREAASRGPDAHSDDPIDIYDRVQTEGGFHLRVQEKSGVAPVTRSGKRIVYIKQVSDSNDPRVINHVQNAYANVALNEIMHHAASGGSSYSNRDLALALYSVLNAEERAKNPVPETSDDEVNGNYFHNFLTGRCPPSGKK